MGRRITRAISSMKRRSIKCWPGAPHRDCWRECAMDRTAAATDTNSITKPRNGTFRIGTRMSAFQRNTRLIVMRAPWEDAPSSQHEMTCFHWSEVRKANDCALHAGQEGSNRGTISPGEIPRSGLTDRHPARWLFAVRIEAVGGIIVARSLCGNDVEIRPMACLRSSCPASPVGSKR